MGEIPAVFVRNLPLKCDSVALFEFFSEAGEIVQIRRGISPKTRGTAFVVYKDFQAAKQALSLKSFLGRFIHVSAFE